MKYERFDTIPRIDEIIGRINTHPEYSKRVSDSFIKHMRSEADLHSNSIELESNYPLTAREKKDLKSQWTRNLTSARDYLSRYGINLASLSMLGKLIDSEGNPNSTFRNEEICFGEFYGVSSSRVHSEMDNLIHSLRNTLDHPIDRAAFAHLEVIRIHPYMDGNGRSARLLQNFCLEQRGYPPIIIPLDERELYFGLMRNYLSEYLNNNEKGTPNCLSENLFKSFIASKVLKTVQSLDEELKKRRIYEISFGKVDEVASLKSFANSIKGVCFKRNIPVVANHIQKKKRSGNIQIEGNIGRDDLEKIVLPIAKKRKLDCSVRSIVDCS